MARNGLYPFTRIPSLSFLKYIRSKILCKNSIPTSPATFTNVGRHIPVRVYTLLTVNVIKDGWKRARSKLMKTVINLIEILCQRSLILLTRSNQCKLYKCLLIWKLLKESARIAEWWPWHLSLFLFTNRDGLTYHKLNSWRPKKVDHKIVLLRRLGRDSWVIIYILIDSFIPFIRFYSLIC